jgi:hypothetical protein
MRRDQSIPQQFESNLFGRIRMVFFSSLSTFNLQLSTVDFFTSHQSRVTSHGSPT